MNGMDKREYEPALQGLVAWALREDVGGGDVTTERTVAPEQRGRGRIVTRERGVLAGWDAAEATFRAADAELVVEPRHASGEALAEGACVATISGRLRGILIAERVALNFLQRLSGIATLTSRFCDALAGTGVRVLDTRKTTPGLRGLEKEAVRAGGGLNHRQGLYDAILIKENHITAAGGIETAIRRARGLPREETGGRAAQISGPLIVEVRDLEEVAVALEASVDRILLDNFDPETLRAAVARITSVAPPRPQIEVSGGLRLENVRDFAIPGVDYVSIGALTHSARALDLALDVEVEAEPA
ncbi:MAG: carboxylating nicotinate-nucleotide diphosphorylase [Candidatus Eisenbacteria bacterium]|nr:carboxylating nicotinate-nucleotide diphosphorylase [Candidatus Eisenbacteria bacterium]